LQGAALIHVAVIAVNLIGRLGEQCRMGKETEPAHPIVHADEDDAKLRQRVALGVKRSLSAHIRAAVNPDHDGQRFGRGGGPQDVERQASFRFRHFVRRLRAFRAEFRRVAHAAPMSRRLRLSPAQLADRRRGIRNTSEADNAVRLQAANLSAVGPDYRCLGEGRKCLGTGRMCGRRAVDCGGGQEKGKKVPENPSHAWVLSMAG
jgi:hypothetical protein